jgi:prepilin-type N-terminal cleavage/methylation domain-containing protein
MRTRDRRQNRPTCGVSTRGVSARGGFSLIEIIVAMTILAVVLLSLSGMAAKAAVRAETNDLLVKRTAALQLEASKLGAMPYATLAALSTTSTAFTFEGFTYTRRLTRTAGTNRYTVKVVIVPARDSTKKDSVTFDRANPPSSTPLCTGC